MSRFVKTHIELKFECEYVPETQDCKDHAGTAAKCEVISVYAGSKHIINWDELLTEAETQIIENGGES